MREIDRHICELLYDHDCVIVPHLGGFLASYSGASIHPVQHTISPPARKVAFNVFLKQNDGLLANQLSGYEHTSYLEAVRRIETYAAACQRELQEGKRVVIEGVGILYNDSENNLQFEPAPSANFLKDSFGLSPIRHLPVSREDQRQKAEKQLKEFVTIRPSVKQDRKRQGAVRASKRILARVVIAGAVLWLGVNVFLVLKNNKDFIAFFSPSAHETEVAVTPKTEPSKPAASEASVQPPVNIESTAAIIAVPETSVSVIEKKDEAVKPADQPMAMNTQKNFSEKEIVAPAPAVQVAKTVPQSNVTEGEKKYFIIAGAFKISSNASSLVAQLQAEGYASARIIPSSNKLTMVCYDGFVTRSDATRVLDSIRVNKRDGWVMAN